MAVEHVEDTIREYEEAYYEALRQGIAQYSALTQAFPQFIVGPKRISAVIARDGIVVSHWEAQQQSYESRRSDEGVSEVVQEITGPIRLPDGNSGQVLPSYSPGLSVEMADITVREGSSPDSGPIVWRAPWQRLEIRPPFEEAAHEWNSLLAESRAMSDVHYFVAAHLMRLKDISDKSVEQVKNEVLTKLEEAIGRFVSLVAANPREEAVQAFLTKNPVLLSPIAVNVRPKHKLGAEHITDFVIVLPNEQYILVEIEAPKQPLFTKSGDPAKELTHAQRQVEDWRHWVRDNVGYARESLPGITDPECWVVLGRDVHMAPRDKKALKHKNAELHRIRILTYDDLIDIAKAHLGNLRGIR